MLHGTKRQLLLGDDGQCFAHALWAVRTFGGILEHPEASYAFSFYGLAKPLRAGGWTAPDKFGGRACCVAQGHYGHDAQKLTWLYGVDIKFRELHWGHCENKTRLDLGYHTKEERARASRWAFKRLSARQRSVTPPAFRDLLLKLVK